MGKLLGGGSVAQPQMPELKAPTVMPDPDEEAQKNAEFRKLSRARSRATTRASTILGDDSDGTTLGG
jgi:hypothetical protein